MVTFIYNSLLVLSLFTYTIHGPTTPFIFIFFPNTLGGGKVNSIDVFVKVKLVKRRLLLMRYRHYCHGHPPVGAGTACFSAET